MITRFFVGWAAGVEYTTMQGDPVYYSIDDNKNIKLSKSQEIAKALSKKEFGHLSGGKPFVITWFHLMDRNVGLSKGLRERTEEEITNRKKIFI